MPAAPLSPRSTERRELFRDLALLLGIPGIAVILLLASWHPWRPTPYVPPESRDIYTVLSGAWDWAAARDRCSGNPHRIAFSSDRKVMTPTQKEPLTNWPDGPRAVFEYDILSTTPSSIRGRIRGEYRRTAAGEPVVWDLQLTSELTYQWHETDWQAWDWSGEVQRCPEGVDSLLRLEPSVPPD